MGKGGGHGKGKGEGRGEGKGEGHGDGSGDYKGKTDRIAVPAMPMPMAVICCVLNFLIPGFGKTSDTTKTLAKITALHFLSFFLAASVQGPI